jgi:hypothetical protein
MAAKFFTGLPLDGPDPECVQGHGERALAAVTGAGAPRPSGDHSHRSRPVPVSIGVRPTAGLQPEIGVQPGAGLPPDRACDESPLAGFRRPT